MAKRKLDVIVGGEYKAGPALKKAGNDLDELADRATKAGDQAGKGLSDGVTDKAGGLGSKLGDIGSKISGVFKGAMLGAGVAGGAALVAGISQVMDTELVGDKLAAQLGSSDWAHEMGGLAADMYAQGFGESMSDVAGALKGVIQHGLLPEDATNAEIEALTAKLMTFSDVLEQDLDMSTQAVSTMLRSRIAGDGAEALDVMTRAVQQGADRAGDLAETFQEYSTMFRDAGLSAADAAGLLVQGLAAGARDADTVADALKEFAIRGQDASEASKAGFEAIGLSAEEMTRKVAQGGPEARDALDQVLDGLRGVEDPVARNAAAVALFGTKAEDLGDALFNLDLDTAATMLGNTEGATDKLGSAYDNAATKIEVFKRQAMQKLTEFIGGQVIPKLEMLAPIWTDHILPALKTAGAFITDSVVPALKGLGDWFMEHKPILIGVATAIGVGLVAAFLSWAAAAGAAAIATLAATWPIIAIGVAIAALVAGVIYAYQNWDLFRTAVDAVARFVTDTLWPALQAVGGWIAGTLVPIIADVIGWWWTFQTAIFNVYVTVAKFVVDVATLLWGWAQTAWDVVTSIGEAIGAVIGFVTSLPGTIASAIDGMWDGMYSAFIGVVNSIIRAWNNLSFTIGGGSYDPLGDFGPSITVPKFTFNTPDLPTLAAGGIVRATPGGILANIGEGRFDEAVIPLDGRHSMGEVTVVIDVRGGDGPLKEWLRNMVRVEGGGDVQVALGRH